MTDLTDPAASPTRQSLLERAATALGGRASVRAVYGEPISQGGVTIVPVARGRFGFGGDEAGGGGGAEVRPLGYVEITDGGSTWHPVASGSLGARSFAVGLGVGLAVGVVVGVVVAATVRGLARRT